MSQRHGAVMVCGTTSNAGKSTVVAGLCRHYARRGLRVAPFKAQNMSNNSAVTRSGHEIARAQAWQAAAAGVEPEVGMNPVLLKPTGEGRSQVVVLGRPAGTTAAADYHRHKPQLLDTVLAALADLRRRYDVVVLEGAGSPAEINLLDADIVNLRLAQEAGLPALVVGDIELGGVFASLFGTVALLPDGYRQRIEGFVINKMRGDPALLLDGTSQLEQRCGIPTLGVLPWLDGPEIDSEDSLALDRPLDPHGYESDGGAEQGAELAEPLDVAVVRLPCIANFTDIDPFRIEPGVRLRWVEDARGVGQPDLLVIPGSKATVTDLAWLRRRGIDRAVAAARGTVLGICAGYQMLGRSITDPQGVESAEPQADGLGLLDAATIFGPAKVTRRRTGELFGEHVAGYQIHHGAVKAVGAPFVRLADGPGDGAVGATPAGGLVWGTTLHGLFESDAARSAVLQRVAARAGKRRTSAGSFEAGSFEAGSFEAGSFEAGSFEAARQHRIDRIADSVEAHLDLAALDRIVFQAGRARG